jgi:hypothetical protein
MKFFIDERNERFLDVNRHVNPNGSLGGYVRLGAYVSPCSFVLQDEIVISQSEDVTSTIEPLIRCRKVRLITLLTINGTTNNRLTVYDGRH